MRTARLIEVKGDEEVSVGAYAVMESEAEDGVESEEMTRGVSGRECVPSERKSDGEVRLL